MAKEFMEALGAAEPQASKADTTVATEPTAVSTVPASGTSTEKQPDTTATQKTEADQQPPVSEKPAVNYVEEAAYWRGRYEAISNAGQKPAEQPATISDEEYKRQEEEFLADPRGTTAKLVNKAIEETKQSIRMETSVVQMRRETTDYDQKIAKFTELAKSDPTLAFQLTQQIDPARFAYNYAKRSEALAAHGGDPEKMRAELEKKLRAEIEQELRQKMALQDAGSTPPTPATAKGSGGIASAKPSSMDPLHGNPFD